jgi:hypothetical protein
MLWIGPKQTYEVANYGSAAINGPFLYAHYTYDPEDPWSSLLRSHLLAYVGVIFFQSFSAVWYSTRLTNMYSHLQVQLRRSQKLHDSEMLTSMAQ